MQRFWQRQPPDCIQNCYSGTNGNVPNHQAGGILMREDGLHSLQWYLVIISEAHPGLDGQVPVVTHYTARGMHKQPAVEVCPVASP